MDHLDALTVLLQKEESGTLTRFVGEAEKYQRQHFSWESDGHEQVKVQGCPGMMLSLSDRTKYESTFHALQHLGFVSYEQVRLPHHAESAPDMCYLTLHPSAFQRVQLERHNRARRTLQLFQLRYKDAMLVASFVISLILGLQEILGLL